MSRTSALTRKPKGLGRRNFAQGYPRSHATPTPTSRSKGQKSRSRGGGILWWPPSRTACFTCPSLYNVLYYDERNCIGPVKSGPPGMFVQGQKPMVSAMLLGIKWYQFVWNDDVRRLTKEPKITAIIQSCGLCCLGIL